MASVVLRLGSLNKARRSLCYMPEFEDPELGQAKLASWPTPREARFLQIAGQ